MSRSQHDMGAAPSVKVPSLGTVELIMALEEAFDLTGEGGEEITADTFLTVGDIKSFVAAHVRVRGGTDPEPHQPSWTREEISRIVDRIVMDVCRTSDFSDDSRLEC